MTNQEWISPTEEETSQSAKRVLLAAHAELKNTDDKTTLKKSVHDILRAFAAAKKQEALDRKTLIEKYQTKFVHDFYHIIPHIVASAIIGFDNIENTHPYSMAGFPIWAFAEASGLLKQCANLKSYIDFIDDDEEFWSDKIESVIEFIPELKPTV